jgi:DNA-binding transcriptional LysR family regulator
VAKELARTGLGAAFLPRAEIRDEDHKDMVIRDLDSKFIIEDFIVHRAGKTSQAIQATIKALASATRPRVNNDD